MPPYTGVPHFSWYPGWVNKKSTKFPLRSANTVTGTGVAVAEVPAVSAGSAGDVVSAGSAGDVVSAGSAGDVTSVSAGDVAVGDGDVDVA